MYTTYPSCMFYDTITDSLYVYSKSSLIHGKAGMLNCLLSIAMLALCSMQSPK